MKKAFITLSAAALLLGTPAAQAAFVSQPVAVTAPATAAAASRMEVATVSGTEASAVAISKVVKTKKLSFFAKAKQLLRGFGNKSQIVALLLALFLGTLGVHRFYLGYTWQGIAQLLLAGGGLGLYIAGIASAVAAVGSGTVALPGLAIAGMVLLIAGSIWVTVDIIRIIIGSLQPKDGSYGTTF